MQMSHCSRNSTPPLAPTPAAEEEEEEESSRPPSKSSSAAAEGALSSSPWLAWSSSPSSPPSPSPSPRSVAFRFDPFRKNGNRPPPPPPPPPLPPVGTAEKEEEGRAAPRMSSSRRVALVYTAASSRAKVPDLPDAVSPAALDAARRTKEGKALSGGSEIEANRSVTTDRKGSVLVI